MAGTLIELTLGEPQSLGAMTEQSFNNDSGEDEVRNSFHGVVDNSAFDRKGGTEVPPEFLHPNVHYYDSEEIYRLGDRIIIGEYCNQGVVVPRTESIVFSKLYNCAPLISLIRGDNEYLSFLHTWAISGDSGVVDRQVNHWMETVSKLGDVSETVFSPRKGRYGSDTEYQTAIEDITRISQTTIVLTRNVEELVGMVNGEGVYFKECGYHLWSE